MVDKALAAVGHALALAGSMTWEILWALILGFALSAMVQAVVRRETIVGLMGDDKPRTLAVAAGLGAASSSCSYAAVALARSLFRKGANFTAAMAFEISSTNLVVELGIILALLMGWQFTAAEFVGGPLMIIVLALLFRLFVRSRLIDAAREQADRGLAGSMEGHAAMDMSVGGEGSFWRRLSSGRAFTSVSHVFVMEWAAILRDLIIGLLIAGAIAAWVPETFWQQFFLTDHPVWSALWGPIVGPFVAIISFVCSIGNVPLAAVLWNGGISFGGVIAFIFADLLILPILNIYRKYYGTKMTLTLLGTFYVSMVVAGYFVELLFGAANLIPSQRSATVMHAGVSWNYTSWLNIVFLVIAAILVVRFVATGGIPMLRMMGGSPDSQSHQHDHSHQCH
ncbi:permease [Mycobacterium ostraviense]